MKHLFTILLLWPILMFGQNELNLNKVSSELEVELIEEPNDFHLISILLQDKVDSRALHQNYRKFKTPLKDRAYEIITKLQAKAASTQGPILNILSQSDLAETGSIEPYWVTNVIFVKAKSELITTLSNRQDIEWIDKSYPLELESYSRSFSPSVKMRVANGHEPGHDAINAPAMWKLGYTGRGRTAMIFDTGVDATHPALSKSYKGNNYFPANISWFDFNDSNSVLPEYCGDHGSHVTGTIVGLDTLSNDTIGVAPNGFWIASNGICNGINQSKATGVYQWALNPDSDPNTIQDMPDVINSSWFNPGLGSECNSYYVSLFNSIEAAGIALVYSAGNAGSSPSSITPPKNINTDTVNVFSVGNINANNPNLPIINSSSRGPSICGGVGSLLIKPEVSAPGTNVRSSVPGGYSAFTGTSMSAPHVAGAILLLKEAFHYLSGTDLKLALYYSAVDLGAPGEDNAYGMGIIDVLAAYNYLVLRGNTPALPSAYNDAAIVSRTPADGTICDSILIPELVIKNEGAVDITSLLINYTLTNGDTGSYAWNGTILIGQSANLILPTISLPPGLYRLDYEISKVNGIVDRFYRRNKESIFFNLAGYPLPEAPDPISVCNGATGLLVANSPNPDVTLRWYEASTGDNYYGDGNQFITPPITANQSYYIGGIYKGKVGLPDNTGSTGIYSNISNNNLTFDCEIASIIRSVKVYANSAGTRHIILKNSSGAILANWLNNIDAGEQVIELNFKVQPGQDYELTMGSIGIVDLYHSFSGFSFPYSYNNFLTITGSSTNLYNYFYDWDVEVEIPCGRVFTFASVSAGNANADFTPSDTLVDISDGSSVQFANNSSNATDYSWNFGDGETSTEANPSHNYFFPGTYQVSLSASGADNCEDAIQKTITIIGEWPYATNIENNFAQLGTFKVYPNPSSGLFEIELDLKRMTQIEFSVFDATGREIWKKEPGSYFKNRIPVNLTDFAQGVYYLSISIDENTLVKKLLKTN